MSEIWSVIPSEIVARESPPRILREIQDVTNRLCQEFSSSGEPITDDNNVLHKLCVKLEYLLQTCLKERTLLSSRKNYWHWMYDCLKRAKGLSDGLRFVQANKELRTSQGKGRALIRYSLVHQTLADSFQNCLMNRIKCSSYLKPACALTSHSNVFLNALYELNEVNFDLISKGYDLDNAWPTFSSKRTSMGIDQWRLPTDRTGSFGSLGSYVSHYTAVTAVPENSNLKSLHGMGKDDNDCIGTASSGIPSVDHRVEELVLELNESDQKIQDQEEALKRLELEASSAAKSASEKQDILARVISELESTNQTLQDAMSRMSSEFQNREHSWETKYSDLQKRFKGSEELSQKLQSKIAVLEEDKRNLEDTVSARMTLITSGFSGTNLDSLPGDSDTEYDLIEKLDVAKAEKVKLEEKIKSLRKDLAAVPSRIENEKRAVALSLSAKYESLENKLKQKMEASLDAAADNIFARLCTAFQGRLSLSECTSSNEKLEVFENTIMELVSEVTDLRRKSSKLQQDHLVTTSRDQEREEEKSELLGKLERVRLERDNAVEEMKTLSEQLVNVDKELQNMKQAEPGGSLKREAEVSDHQRDMLEIKESNFHLQESIKREELSNKALKDEIRFLQQKCNSTTLDLKSCRQRCANLEEQYDKSVEGESDMITEKQKRIDELEETVEHLEKQSIEDGKLQDACIEHNEKLEKEVLELHSQNNEKNLVIEKLREEIDNLKTSRDTLKQEKASLTEELSYEKSKMQDETQKNSHLSTALSSITEAFENTEKEYKTLSTNLMHRDHDSAEVQMNAIKVCIETERLLAKKEYDELSGENESRKRMIAALEKKLEKVKVENLSMAKIVTDFKEVQSNLQETLAEKEEYERSLHETEQELINAVEKLETEREHSIELKKRISEGIMRETDLKNEMTDMESISSELKAKLIQLVQEKDALWKELDELKYFQKLQEDGDETDARWMEDQEARYCLHCGAEFSIIVRKHHCRVCGKIFCSKCSKQWIKSSDGKLERCCIGCLERHRSANEIKTLTSGIPSPSKTSSPAQPVKGNTVLNDNDFDTITDEDLTDSHVDDNQPSSSATGSSSIYVTADTNHSDISRDSLASIPDDEIENKSKTVTLTAGDFLRLPVEIQSEGDTLSWTFSTDRSIDFQLSYCSDMSDKNEKIIIEKCRYEPHVDPIQGQVTVEDVGVYILEFDNRFSRFMSKSLKYSIQVKKS